MNQELKQQIVEQIKSANNVLVAVSTNPTVDELAASVGLTLALNKMDKHATTVFSGVVPSTIEFLQPEKTIETTTDSLRDFIIALDKSKADKLRYKVEDDVVRIFITPYRTSITDKDLEFSQGDFNVDVVIALGVTKREDLDRAITAHGRILHDATVIALTKQDSVSELGAINWQEKQASSLCEMIAVVTTELDAEVIDGQMATAFLTGIIAETDRFRNEKTTPLALSLSSQLMTAGANQQLIAEKLEEPVVSDQPMPLHVPQVDQAPHASTDQKPEPVQKPQSDDGALEIEHSKDEGIEKIHIDEHGNFGAHDGETEQPPEEVSSSLLPDINKYLGTEDDASDASRSSETEQALTPDSNEDEPTLKQPESGDVPFMTHGKTIQPPATPGEPPKSDKPFDLQEAMQSLDTHQPPDAPTVKDTVPAPSQASPASLPVDTPSQLPPPPPAPVVTDPIPAPIEEPPKLVIDTPPTVAAQAPPEEKPAPPAPIIPPDTLAALEKSVESPHAQTHDKDAAVDAARSAVGDASAVHDSQFPTPDQAVGAQPVNLEPDADAPRMRPLGAPDAPPPVPPPMTPQFFDNDGNDTNPFLNPPK